jgi:DNA polymerase III subunit alpha
MEIEELRLQPGLEPIYLSAGAFVGLSRRDAEQVFEIIGRHRGESPLLLVSDDGKEEHIFAVENSSDLYAELKQLLGPRCISTVRKASEPTMEQVS